MANRESRDGFMKSMKKAFRKLSIRRTDDRTHPSSRTASGKNTGTALLGCWSVERTGTPPNEPSSPRAINPPPLTHNATPDTGTNAVIAGTGADSAAEMKPLQSFPIVVDSHGVQGAVPVASKPSVTAEQGTIAAASLHGRSDTAHQAEASVDIPEPLESFPISVENSVDTPYSSRRSSLDPVISYTKPMEPTLEILDEHQHDHPTGPTDDTLMVTAWQPPAQQQQPKGSDVMRIVSYGTGSFSLQVPPVSAPSTAHPNTTAATANSPPKVPPTPPMGAVAPQDQVLAAAALPGPATAATPATAEVPAKDAAYEKPAHAEVAPPAAAALVPAAATTTAIAAASPQEAFQPSTPLKAMPRHAEVMPATPPTAAKMVFEGPAGPVADSLAGVNMGAPAAPAAAPAAPAGGPATAGKAVGLSGTAVSLWHYPLYVYVAAIVLLPVSLPTYSAYLACIAIAALTKFGWSVFKSLADRVMQASLSSSSLP